MLSIARRSTAVLLAVAGLGFRAAAQEAAAPAGLTPAEIQSLAKEFAAYRGAIEVDDREALEKALTSAKKAFEAVAAAHKVPSLLAIPEPLVPVFRSTVRFDKNFKKSTVASRTASFLLEGADAKASYSVFVPATYQIDRSFPLVVALPPKGMDAKEYLRQVWSRGNAVAIGIERKTPLTLGTRADQLRFWLPFKDVLEAYAVDYDRVVVDGAEDGAVDALVLAANSPGTFAGVVVRSPVGAVPSLASLLHVPVHIVIGTKEKEREDRAPAKEKGKAAFLAVQNASDAEGTTLTTANGNGPAFDTEAQSAVSTWVEARRRAVYPDRVRVEGPNRLAWVEALEMESNDLVLKGERPRLDARIDRAKNLVTVDSKHVFKYRVYVNAKLLDLGRPVEIRTNGTLSYQGTVEPSLDRLLEFQALHGDPAAIFTTWIDVDVATAPATGAAASGR